MASGWWPTVSAFAGCHYAQTIGIRPQTTGNQPQTTGNQPLTTGNQPLTTEHLQDGLSRVTTLPGHSILTLGQLIAGLSPCCVARLSGLEPESRNSRTGVLSRG